MFLNILEPPKGLEPRSHVQQGHAETQKNDAKSEQFSALEKSSDTDDQQNPSTSTHQECVPSVHQNPDLDQVVTAWDDLPDLIKARILELVKTST